MKSWEELRLREEALGGLCAGVVGTIIGFPLDLVKTRMQTGTTKQTTIFSVGQSIVKEEGIRALYKGLWPPLISLSILNTVTFAQYSMWREFYNANPGWDQRNFFAGISCAPVSGVVSTVENLVKTQMQLDNITTKQYRSSFSCVKTLIQSHGVGIIYTGHMINTVREATFLGSYFFVYEGLREGLVRSSAFANHVQVAIPIAGGLSGAFSWFLSFPLDCVRAGVQGQRLPPQLGARQVLVSLLRERGVWSLYSGASASIARAFLVSGSRFSAYEGALWMLRGGRNYERHHD
ncbi:unnamed protein product [Cylindrotheca closterium]|uniref:Mitochondrial carrier protein n=1 Tax=Cylindrotheca closterium TaxID=2856 RepID=A0AAD2G9H3_9STRA|nr:unnamed protein product [Cylindrotheca closterium]